MAAGYVVERGTFSRLEVPGALFTIAWDVNGSRVIAGAFGDAAGVAHGFTYDGRTFTRIDAPGAAQTRVFGINDRGDVVGFFIDPTGRTHGFVAQVSQ